MVFKQTRGFFLFSLIVGLSLALGQTQAGESARRASATEQTREVAAPAAIPSQEDEAGVKDYVIGAEDVLSIDVFNVPELSQMTVRVDNQGMISLPLLGRMQAEGLTPQQLRENLERRWGEAYLENPQVTIYVKEYRAQPVSVIGAVERPGLYQLSGPRSLIEMLSLAGGTAKRNTAPAGRTVIVTRANGFGAVPHVEGLRLISPEKLEIDLYKLLYSRLEELNIPIMPRDIISVSKADVVYVVGDVRKPGGFVLEDREHVTVLQALAMAEGLAPNAKKGDARLIRRFEDGSKKEIPVDLGKILKGKGSDVEMAANDILFVPGSGSKAAAKRGAEAAISTISGVLIWRR